MIRITLIGAVVSILFPLYSPAQSSGEYTRWKIWCRSIGRIPAGTPSNPICLPGVSTPAPIPTPSAEETRRLEAERLRKEKEQKAAEADRKGVEAAKRGSWEEAINFFFEALKFAPDSQAIRTHLAQAQAALTDIKTSQEMKALRQRVESALAAADIEAFRQKMEDEIAVRQIETLRQSLTGQNIKTENLNPTSRPAMMVNNQSTGAKIKYPFSSTPIASNSPPGQVLKSNQAKIKSLDLEIRRAQKVLLNLIKQNSKNEEERLEWVKRSEEASLSAQDLSINLVLDLIGAHLDHQMETTDQERKRVLDQVLSRREGEQGSQVAYGILVNRKNEILRLQKEVDLAKKENELRAKIRDFSMKDRKITLENFWDVFSQFKIVDKLAGPSKDLVDSAYTIYKQAASLEIVAITLNNQEKAYQAAEKLRSYIVRLVAQKKSLSAGK